MQKTRRTAEELFPLVAQFLQGGQTRDAFCAAHGLSLSVLAYWRKEYAARSTSSPAPFLELEVPARMRGRSWK